MPSPRASARLGNSSTCTATGIEACLHRPTLFDGNHVKPCTKPHALTAAATQAANPLRERPTTTVATFGIASTLSNLTTLTGVDVRVTER